MRLRLKHGIPHPVEYPFHRRQGDGETRLPNG
jgi:hypothetical protein